jgi:hypothetical protein
VAQGDRIQSVIADVPLPDHVRRQGSKKKKQAIKCTQSYTKFPQSSTREVLMRLARSKHEPLREAQLLASSVKLCGNSV